MSAATLLSWHDVGQPVSPIAGGRWVFIYGDGEAPQLDHASIYTIGIVTVRAGVVCLGFDELAFGDLFRASDFRPVYPRALDALRTLLAPTPTRVPEDA